MATFATVGQSSAELATRRKAVKKKAVKK